MATRLSKRATIAVVICCVLASCGREKNTERAGVQDPALAQSIKDGQLVYRKYCLACHLAGGQGAPPMNPPLVKTSFVTGDKSHLIGIILRGMSNAPVDGERYRNVMPPFEYLPDKEIADVLNYVRHTFGNGGELVKILEVKEVRQVQVIETK